MVLTKSELIGALDNEVRILLHLAGKVDRTMLDYRPTPRQRSTIELLRYLTMMGPALVEAATAGRFDPPRWTEAEQAAAALDLDGTLAAIATQTEVYKTLFAGLSDDDLRAEVEMFGEKSSRGAFLVANVLCGHAAYRMQLFLYLKLCGREELNTMNLWAGVDAPATA